MISRCFYIALYLWFACASSYATEAQVFSETVKLENNILLISNINSLVEIEIKSDFESLSTQRSSVSKGAVFFFVGSKAGVDTVTLVVRKLLIDGVTFSPKISIISAESYRFRKHALRFQQALEHWRERGEVEVNELAQLILEPHGMKDSVSLKEHFVAFLLEGLFRREQYAECSAFADQLLQRYPSAPIYSEVRYQKAKCGLASDIVSGDEQLALKIIADAEISIHPGKKWIYRVAALKLALASKQLIRSIVQSDTFLFESAKVRFEALEVDLVKLGDKLLLAAYYNAVSPYYSHIGSYGLAKEKLTKSLNIHRTIGVTKRLADTLNNIARLYQRTGERRLAILSLLEAIEIDKEFSSHSDTGFLMLQLANNYYEVGNFGAAKIKFQVASNLFSNAGNQYGYHLAIMALGSIHNETGNYEEALSLTRKAESFFSTGGQKYSRYLALAESQLLNVWVESRKGASKYTPKLNILNLVNSISKYVEAEKLSAETLDMLLSISNYYMASGQIGHLERKLADIEGLLDLSPTGSFRLQRLKLLTLRFEIAQFLNLELVGNGYVEQLRELESEERSDVGGGGYDVAFARLLHRAQSIYVNTLFEYAQKCPVRCSGNLFSYLEEVSAVSLRSEILRANGMIDSLDDYSQLSSFDEIALKGGKEKDIAMSDGLDGLLSLRINNIDNTAHDLQLESLDLQTVRNSIDSKDLLIRYYLSENISFVMFISKKSIQLSKIKNDRNLKQAVFSHYKTNSRRGVLKTTTSGNLANTLRLTQDYIGRYSDLTIVADSFLHVLSFDALKISTLDGQYELVDRHSVVNVYSFSQYLSERVEQGSEMNQDDLAIFANPKATSVLDLAGIGFDDAPKSKSILSNVTSYSELPFSLYEARSVASIFPNKKTSFALGRDANRGRLLGHSFRQAKVLHIASHGFYSEDVPDVIGIAVTPQNETESNILSMRELSFYNFSSNLVVLSGCETAIGVSNIGEGLDGLSRLFIKRGAGAALGTLWKVADRPTAKFMETFYKKIRDTKGNAPLALVQAKREFKKNTQFRHPHFWSGFVLSSGDRRSTLSVWK